MGCCVVSKCCCCISLRAGCLIIGYILLVTCILEGGYCITKMVSNSQEDVPKKLDDSNPNEDQSPKDDSINGGSSEDQPPKDDSTNSAPNEDEPPKDDSKKEDSEKDDSKKDDSKPDNSKEDDSKKDDSKKDDSKKDDSKKDDSKKNDSKSICRYITVVLADIIVACLAICLLLGVLSETSLLILIYVNGTVCYIILSALLLIYWTNVSQQDSSTSMTQIGTSMFGYIMETYFIIVAYSYYLEI